MDIDKELPRSDSNVAIRKKHKYYVIMRWVNCGTVIFSALFIYGNLQFNPEGTLASAITLYVKDQSMENYYSMLLAVFGLYLINAVPIAFQLLIVTLDLDEPQTKLMRDIIGSLMMVSLGANLFMLWWLLSNTIIPFVDIIFLDRMGNMPISNTVYLTNIWGGVLSLLIHLLGIASFNIFIYELVRKRRRLILGISFIGSALFWGLMLSFSNS
ncbi:hypothetical protein HGA91_06100 [candidate division WWE3 bacterium]|nr:hypothetical protein [candidate division WWE3 bacterium]